MKRIICIGLLLMLSAFAGSALAQEARDRAGGNDTELFDLRRVLIERIEDAVTTGDVSALRRMAGIESTAEPDYDGLLGEASSLLEEFKDVRLPTSMEQRQARDDLYNMIGDIDDRQAYLIFQAAKHAIDEDRRAMEEIQTLGERIDENRQEREGRGRELGSDSPAVGQVEFSPSCHAVIVLAGNNGDDNYFCENEFDAVEDASILGPVHTSR